MRKSPVKLTDEQVVNTFKLSASGMTNAAIARRFNCSDNTIARVLSRKSRPDVKVPAELVRAAAKVPKQRGKKANLRRMEPAAATNGAGRAEALSRYTEACYALTDAEEVCRQHGVQEEVLSSLLNVVSGDSHI